MAEDDLRVTCGNAQGLQQRCDGVADGVNLGQANVGAKTYPAGTSLGMKLVKSPRRTADIVATLDVSLPWLDGVR